MIDDKLFISIDFKGFEVNSSDIAMFLDVINKRCSADAFIFETEVGFFKVDKVNKIFRILKRKQKDSMTEHQESDFIVMAMYKIAKRSGFKCFLENKYMN